MEEEMQKVRAVRSMLEGDVDEKEVKKDIDNNTSSRYNISKRVTSYISYSQIGLNNVRYIRGKLSELYNGIVDGIANGIAIEQGNTVYIVDSGIDNGEISFGVRKRITISNSQLRNQRMEEINERAISKGHVSVELSEKIRGASDNNSRSGIGRKLQEQLSLDKGKSRNQQKGISDENAVGGGSVRCFFDVNAQKPDYVSALRRIYRFEMIKDVINYAERFDKGAR
ncbi:MAG: hypothetical protein IKD47_02915 [Clostridia bacterium]|nr:hypothetical protein [Clostridia bacterium]